LIIPFFPKSGNVAEVILALDLTGQQPVGRTEKFAVKLRNSLI
jgi:hypothetical protein